HNLIRFNGSIESYFHPETFKEILCARKFFLIKGELDASESLVQSCLLHILHGNRPYALSRKSHPITPFAPTGDFIYSNLVIKLIKKVERVLQNSDDIPDTGSKVFYQDSTKSWPEEVNNLDAIITSPPFYDSTRFYSANWMRLWFSGWEKDDFQTKPKDFVDETQKKSFEIYDNIFKQSQQCLKKDGVFLMHVGKSKKSDMAGQIAKIGSNYLSLIDIFDESVEHCESHGIKDKGTTTHHQYLVFTKD
ncbi:TPA: SAM-dependent methyltransferase, partial [Klebsiella pneumoniae]|nr:SAM-dependent methyltransferase [Klebsiella pneumoniae]